MIKFENVSKSFGPNITALYDINLEIADGEFVFIVGASGAGKTTLLNMINRLITPTKGKIMFNEWDVVTMPSNQIYQLRRKIGYIFQDYKLLMDRTVEENVALTLDVQGKDQRTIDSHVKEALDIVGLGGKGRLFPRELAGGEVQRVAIARAIIANPQVLLCDEPTADLDPKNAWSIVRLLEKINSENKTTVIMATHNTEIVDQMRKRVVVMEGGRIIGDEHQSTYHGAASKRKEKPVVADTMEVLEDVKESKKEEKK